MLGERLTRDVSARGVRMRVLEQGDGPAVVLVHDFLASHTSFDDVVGPLAQRFRVVVPDLPGFGGSEKPSPTRYAYGIEAFAEALADLVAALGLGRARVVGHAMGGAAALTLAALHPELVDRLVLVDPLVYPFPLDARTRLALLPGLGGVLFKQMLGRAGFLAWMRDRCAGPAYQPSADRLDALYEGFHTPAARESAFAVLHAIVDTRAVVARISRVRAPSLIVWGREDRALPVRDGQRLARAIAGARLELLESGHAPHEEQPEAFLATVSDFLGGA